MECLAHPGHGESVTARIASGDLDAQAEVLSHDEIGLLATEFNRMAEHIRQLHREDCERLERLMRDLLDLSKIEAGEAAPMGRPATAAQPKRPRIEAVTMNGFHIVHTGEVGYTTLEHPGEYHFLVQDPKGQEQDVVVQVDASAVAMVEQMIHRPLPIASSFWTSYAENILATYVWNEGRIPAMPLIITQVDRRDVDLAARWEETVR